MTDDADRPQTPPPGGRPQPGPAPRVGGGRARPADPVDPPGARIDPAGPRDRAADAPIDVDLLRTRMASGAARSLPELLAPRKPTLAGAPATMALLLLFVGVELLLLIAPDGGPFGPDGLRRTVYEWFALRPIEPIAVWYGQASAVALLGLATHMALHGGLLHLLFNGGATLILGPPLERSFGTPLYLALFLIGGIAGGLVHTVWEFYTVEDLAFLAVPLVGASGAICALFGAQIVAQARLQRAFALDPAARSAAVGQAVKIVIGFLAINLAITFLDSFVSGAAHVGGFLAGLLFGLAIAPRRA